MGKVIGYARVSTDEQARSGLGIEGQRAAIDAEALRRGWTVDYVVDDGHSGATLRRPGLALVLEQITAGDVLVAAKLDRLGRSTVDVLGLADRADREGWSLIVLDLGLDTTTPVGRFTLTALAAVAQLERDLIAQRTRDAMGALKARGVRLGRPAELDPAIRARIVADRTAGLTLQAIADTLTAEGVPTARDGARWYPSTVRAAVRSAELDAEADAARAQAAA